MNFDAHVINGLVPVADAFDTIQYTDIIDAGNGEGVLFIIQTGATAGAGTQLLLVNASSTITATAETAVPFIYRQCVATDVWGEWTAVAATGVTVSTGVAKSMGLGLIGFGEAYLTGAWDAEDLGGFLTVLAAEMADLVPKPLQALKQPFPVA
jgi:hypothetical protein